MAFWEELNEFPFLVGTSSLLLISFIFAVVAIATNGWSGSNTISYYVNQYNVIENNTEKLALCKLGIYFEFFLLPQINFSGIAREIFVCSNPACDCMIFTQSLCCCVSAYGLFN